MLYFLYNWKIKITVLTVSFACRIFDKEQWKSARQPTSKQLDKLRLEGFRGGPSFVQWFRQYVIPSSSSFSKYLDELVCFRSTNYA